VKLKKEKERKKNIKHYKNMSGDNVPYCCTCFQFHSLGKNSTE